jgi:hypothetical protein
MLIRKSLLSEIVPLKELPGADDIDLQIQLAQRAPFDYVNEPLVLRRDLTESRGGASGATEGRRQLLEDYQELYEEQPPEVRRYALASIHRRQGKQLLTERSWSLTAIREFAKLNYYAPEPEIQDVGLLVTSLFGSPGLKLGRWVNRLIRG